MIRRFTIACLFALVTFSVEAQEARPAPEAATGITEKHLAIATKHMVVAAHPLAAEAGRDMLRQGGNAIDAAIATQLVLGLVEPQSSGLGGGAFLVFWDAKSRETKTYDGREAAPAAAKPDRFLIDGRPMDFVDAVHSGLSVGVPGVVRLLEVAHRRHGKLSWPALFAPAIKLAEDGFPVPLRLSRMLELAGAEDFSLAARAYFFDADGKARTAGFLLKNPEYAATLTAIATRGSAAFYEGPIAQSIVDAVAGAPTKGDLTLADLSGYAVKERPPVCFLYRTYNVCGMGPPSSGAITVGQTLKLIEPFADVRGGDARMSAAALHIIAEAEKLAYADRSRYLADPDVVSIPHGLLDDGYLAERRKLIDPQKAMAKPRPGLPPGLAKKTFGIDATQEAAGTSHISIIDGEGNAVSMTTTIEGAFGSHLWASGFLLNNELTDFSFAPVDKEGVAIANAVAGGKRPRSSMAPTIVFNADGDVEIVTGSPGGSRIIMFVVKTLVAMLDWQLDAQEAATLLNFGSYGGPFLIEHDVTALWPGLMLKTYGHTVFSELMTSGINTIAQRSGRLEGGTDPRREGAALGD